MRAVSKWLCGLLATALCVCPLSACSERGGDSFGFTISGEPRYIDPQTAQDTASLTVIDAIFEGLTRLDEAGNVQPGAADWAVSEDGKTYTFTLRESCWSTVHVRGEETGFEDPVLVTAYDFEFGIRRIAEPTTASPWTGLLSGIENAESVLSGKQPLSALGVQALDDRTLVIRLDAPDDGFLKRLASSAFAPCNRAFFEYTRGRYGLEKQYVLANGAFYLSAWEHGVSVSLRKNEEYHASGEILPASVKYRVSTSQTEDFELLTKGNLDAAFVPASELNAAKDADITLVEMRDTVQYLWFNHTVTPLQDSAVRGGLAAAVEWEQVWKNLPAGYEKYSGFVAPAATGVPAEKQYATDVTEARRLLAEGLARVQLERMPALELLAADDTESANQARYILQSFSKNLGITCNLRLVDAETLAARVQSGNYQMAICAVTGKGLSANENLETFTANAGTGNYARFADAAYDALYAAGNTQKMYDYLYETTAVLPLAVYTRYYGVRAEVSGVTVRPFNGGTVGAALAFRGAEIL